MFWNITFARAEPCCCHKHHADILLNSTRDGDAPASTPVPEVRKKKKKKRRAKPGPLLSLSISDQAPLDTQEPLGLAFVGHLSLLLSSTSLLQNGSLEWEITLRITPV